MGKKTASNPSLASSHWHKEVQRCISLSALDTTYGMGAMSKASLEKQMVELFHGTGAPNNVSYVSLCLEGQNQFNHLWEDREENNGKLRVK